MCAWISTLAILCFFSSDSPSQDRNKYDYVRAVRRRKASPYSKPWFFAASADLSGEPEQLGSLKGQDVGKVMVAALLIVGVAMATVAAMTGWAPLTNAVTFFKSVILT